MKISDLMNTLTEFKEKYGDMEIASLVDTTDEFGGYEIDFNVDVDLARLNKSGSGDFSFVTSSEESGDVVAVRFN